MKFVQIVLEVYQAQKYKIVTSFSVFWVSKKFLL